MYLHIGQNEIIQEHRVIGIFDLDKCSTSKRTSCSISSMGRLRWRPVMMGMAQ